MEPNAETSHDERAIKVDQYSVTRDYCYMRMKVLSEAPGSIGITVEDLNEISRDFHAAQINVLESMSMAERSAEFSHTIKFDQKYLNLKSRIMQASKECLSSNKNCDSGLAKLPKITMKPFDGKLENWVSFKELYDSLIHNRELAEVEKLHYLLSSVQGTAYDLIKNFPLTGSSYKAAYQALHKYYDRKRNIATTYYENLLKCESVRNKSGSELERIHRTFNENLAILARYELPNQDFILFQMVWSKLDSVTREAFELQLGPDVDIPLFDDIMDFLDKRARALENCYGYHNPSKQVTSKNKTSLVVPPQLSCEFCPNEGHMGEACPTFLNLSPAGRFKDVKVKRLCILCLQPSHSVKKCTVSVLCSKCNQRHHTLLHFEEPSPTGATSQEHEEAPPVALAAYSSNADALCPTAVVLVKNDCNKLVKVRILLDSASACNFITLSCARRLGLKIHSKAQSVNGIGRVSTNTLGSVKCELGSQTQDSSGNLVVEAAVLQTICQDMPAGHIDVSSWEHLEGLELADPEFNTPEPVDMLVSVNILSSALKPGLKKGAPGQAIAISTVFGWIVMGECTIGTDFSRLRNNLDIRKDCFLVSNLSLGNSVKESWEPEKVDSPKPTPYLSIMEPTVMCRHIKPSSAITKQVPVGQPFPFIEIQDGIPADCWHNVLVAGNPVDHSSCGLLPVELTPCQSWWSGPRIADPPREWPQTSMTSPVELTSSQSWWSGPRMADPPREWPQISMTSKNEVELKERKGIGSNVDFVYRILDRSSWSRIVDVLAYCFRFFRNWRLSRGSTNALFTIRPTKSSHSLAEHVQEALRKLYPFADVNGLLKGRLSCGDLSFNRNHPLLTHLLLEEYRGRCFHPGPQTLRNLLVPDSWIFAAIGAVQSILLSCLNWFHAEPRLSTPRSLPAYGLVG